jgi:hypothetical protein
MTGSAREVVATKHAAVAEALLDLHHWCGAFEPAGSLSTAFSAVESFVQTALLASANKPDARGVGKRGRDICRWRLSCTVVRVIALGRIPRPFPRYRGDVDLPNRRQPPLLDLFNGGVQLRHRCSRDAADLGGGRCAAHRADPGPGRRLIGRSPTSRGTRPRGPGWAWFSCRKLRRNFPAM